MGFNLPSFPLTVGIYDTRDWAGPPGTLRLTTVCNFVSRWPAFTAGPDDNYAIQCTQGLILLPKGTDVRDYRYGGESDWVEVIVGSLAYYSVDMVEDRGKGFANEHRVAYLRQISAKFPLR